MQIYLIFFLEGHYFLDIQYSSTIGIKSEPLASPVVRKKATEISNSYWTSKKSCPFSYSATRNSKMCKTSRTLSTVMYEPHRYISISMGRCECMIFILDGCSFHVAHEWCKQGLFPRKKIGFDDSFDVTKCLQQIEMPPCVRIVKLATI